MFKIYSRPVLHNPFVFQPIDMDFLPRHMSTHRRYSKILPPMRRLHLIYLHHIITLRNELDQIYLYIAKAGS